MDSFGIALGGGGAKGSYEIGVWQALKELEIPVTAVVGTSVGALNGAIIVQNEFDTAYNFWTGITAEKVINLENEVFENYNMLSIVKKAIRCKGLDVTPLKRMLKDVIDERKIRKSPVDLGLVTFSLGNFKPVRIFKDDVPHGRLVDYLLASSCFPAFKPYRIGNEIFIDGGVYDNIPFSMLIEKGIKNIIIVDVSAPGLVRKIDQSGLNVYYIKNSEELGGILDFNGERSKANIEIGYYDALRVFGKFKGKRYFILPYGDTGMDVKNRIKSLDREDLDHMYGFFGLDMSERLFSGDKFIAYRLIRTIRKYSCGDLNYSSLPISLAEICAEQLGITRRRVYTFEELAYEILKEYINTAARKEYSDYVKNVNRIVLSKSNDNMDEEMGKLSYERKFLIFYHPYFEETDEGIKKFRRFIALASPKAIISNLFVSMLLSRKYLGEQGSA